MIIYLTAIKDNRILNVHKLDYKGSCNHLSKYLDKYDNGTRFEFRFAHNSEILIECPCNLRNVGVTIGNEFFWFKFFNEAFELIYFNFNLINI